MVARSEPLTIKVLRVKHEVDEDDIEDVLATGSNESILKYLERKDIYNFDFRRLFWLCKDPKFFKDLLAILKRRAHFEPEILQFAMHHGEKGAMRDYLTRKLASLVGPGFHSTLVSANEMEESQDHFNFLDYFPLINARAHKMNRREDSVEEGQWILNREMRHTYQRFLQFLIAKRAWNMRDRLMLATYLVLQERRAEAAEQLAKIKPEKSSYGDPEIQYDYLMAYLDIARNGSDFKKAKQIALKYMDYPVQQ